MKTQICFFVLFGLLLTSCASYEGDYYPNCMATVGDTIKLGGGKFVWDKLTDEVRLNDAGDRIDQFPNFPKRGSYRHSGRVVYLLLESGEVMLELALRRDGGRTYLLMEDQLDAWEKGNRNTHCVLVQEDAIDDSKPN